MFRIIAILVAITIGLAAGIQPAMNAGMGKIIGLKTATLINFIIGGILLILVNMLTGGLKDIALIRNVPWYLLVGSGLGVAIVFGSMYAVTAIGSGAALAILVAFQLSMGMLVDHFGLFGTVKVPIDWVRIAGFIIMLIGVRLIMR